MNLGKAWQETARIIVLGCVGFMAWNDARNVSRREYDVAQKFQDQRRGEDLESVRQQIKTGLEANSVAIRRVEDELAELTRFLMRRADVGKQAVGKIE